MAGRRTLLEADRLVPSAGSFLLATRRVGLPAPIVGLGGAEEALLRLARGGLASAAGAGSAEVSAVLIGPVAGAGSSPAAPGLSAVSPTGWRSTASEASSGASAAAGSVAASVAGTTPGSCPAVATGGSSDVVAPAATRRFRNRCDALPAFPLRSPFRLPSVRLRVERTTVVRGGLRTAMVRGPVRCRGWARGPPQAYLLPTLSGQDSVRAPEGDACHPDRPDRVEGLGQRPWSEAKALPASTSRRLAADHAAKRERGLGSSAITA